MNNKLNKALIYILTVVGVTLILATFNQNRRLNKLERDLHAIALVVEQIRPAAPTGAKQLGERR